MELHGSGTIEPYPDKALPSRLYKLYTGEGQFPVDTKIRVVVRFTPKNTVVMTPST